MTGRNAQDCGPHHKRMSDVNLFRPEVTSQRSNLPDSSKSMEALSGEKLRMAAMAHLPEPFTVEKAAKMYVEAIRIDAFRDLRDQPFRARVDTDSIDQQRDPNFPRLHFS
jgi:hypothetical protein